MEDIRYAISPQDVIQSVRSPLNVSKIPLQLFSLERISERAVLKQFRFKVSSHPEEKATTRGCHNLTACYCPFILATASLSRHELISWFAYSCLVNMKPLNGPIIRRPHQAYPTSHVRRKVPKSLKVKGSHGVVAREAGRRDVQVRGFSQLLLFPGKEVGFKTSVDAQALPFFIQANCSLLDHARRLLCASLTLICYYEPFFLDMETSLSTRYERNRSASYHHNGL